MRAIVFAAAAAAAAALLKPMPLAGTQEAALASLSRIIGRADAADVFTVALNADAFPCATASGGGGAGPVVLTAATAVDAIYVAGRYLTAVANASFSWEATGGVSVRLPPAGSPLPAVPGGKLQVCRAAGQPWSYYMNVVQLSYSNVFWNSTRWTAELDWMALHGVNVALAYTGQEALWRTAFRQLGLNDTVIEDYFNGPTYLAWSRGQGIQGVGGPLPSWWYDQQLALAQGLVSSMLDLGITPVLPAFQGNVPPALHFLFPSSNISTNGWLDVFDPLFGRVQDLYMAALQQAFPRTGHFYEADGLFSHASGPWAAGVPLTGAPPDPDAQARAAAAYASFAKWDPEAIWCYQTWIWRGFSTLQDLEYIQGWLSGPPDGAFFLLDQTAERVPIWSKFDNFSFFNHSFVWLAMNEMGGNLGLFGLMDGVGTGVQTAVNGSGGALVGVGIDPEGINQNPAYFEYTLDTAFGIVSGEGIPSAAQYLSDWSVGRCGIDDASVRAAYALLAETVYRPNQTNYEHHMAYCSVALPLAGDSWNSPMVRPGFSAAALAATWGTLIDAAAVCPSPGIVYDIVDIGREFLSLFPCVTAFDAMVAARNVPTLQAAFSALNDTLTDLDTLLGTHPAFLVGAWIRDARAMATAANGTAADADLMEWDARSQVTTWYPTPPSPTNGLYDYANKQYNGIVRDYYLQRYAAYANLASAAIPAGKSVNATDYIAALTAIGQQWTTATAPASVYPAEPQGDAVTVARALFNKYAAPLVSRQ